MIKATQQEQLWLAIKSDVGTYRTTTRGSWASRAMKWVRDYGDTVSPSLPFGKAEVEIMRFIKIMYKLASVLVCVSVQLTTLYNVDVNNAVQR